MDPSNIQDLYDIAERVTFYYQVRKDAIRFIFENNISDRELSATVVLMSAVWAGHQRGEDVSEEDLYILFGLKAYDDRELSDTGALMRLHPDQHHLTLQEILEVTVEKYSKG
jgi:hypothetical protein